MFLNIKSKVLTSIVPLGVRTRSRPPAAIPPVRGPIALNWGAVATVTRISMVQGVIFWGKNRARSRCK